MGSQVSGVPSRCLGPCRGFHQTSSPHPSSPSHLLPNSMHPCPPCPLPLAYLLGTGWQGSWVPPASRSQWRGVRRPPLGGASLLCHQLDVPLSSEAPSRSEHPSSSPMGVGCSLTHRDSPVQAPPLSILPFCASNLGPHH